MTPKDDLNELDFTIEFNSPLNDALEADLFAEADRRLRELAEGRDDMRGAAINIRAAGKTEQLNLLEATVVAYVRPANVAATEKDHDAMRALKGALSAVERQIHDKRAKLKRHWERPGNDPVSQEVAEIMAAEGELPESEEKTNE